MNAPMSSKRLLAAALGTMLVAAGGSVAAEVQQPATAGMAQAATIVAGLSSASAQSRDRSNSRSSRSSRGTRDKASKKDAEEVVQIYPAATREAPEPDANKDDAGKITAMMELYDADKGAEARAMADQIVADPETSAYAKAYASQVAGRVAYEADDTNAAIAYFKKLIDLNVLDNNAHYNIMLNLAQMQQQQEQYDASLATFERFFSETGNQDPANLMMQGQGLYLMERYDEAAAIMKRAIEASADPKPEWQALLMQVYAESGNAGQAVAMAEKVAAAKPDDKRAQLNLAVTYQTADLPDKALAVLERLRASGQLSTETEYQMLYTTYFNLDGREKDVVAVINEGLEKGALKPDRQTYAILAQSYYYSDQLEPAIAAYKKAAPLDSDGSTYLNLAKVLHQEGRIGEAKDAARKALGKGLESKEDANRIIALPGN